MGEGEGPIIRRVKPCSRNLGLKLRIPTFRCTGAAPTYLWAFPTYKHEEGNLSKGVGGGANMNLCSEGLGIEELEGGVPTRERGFRILCVKFRWGLQGNVNMGVAKSGTKKIRCHKKLCNGRSEGPVATSEGERE